MKFEKNPAAWAALVQAGIALAAVYVQLPTEALTAFILAALGLGVHAQKMENRKTEAALFTDPE